MSGPALRVLLIGAAGAFGSRLAAALAAEPGLELIAAGRRPYRLDQLLRSLPPATLQTATLDRDQLSAADLTRLRAAVVIDAAGPFQTATPRVIEASIQAGCHYIDLADGRAFVAAVPRFDAAAGAARVAVISGASSTPALSHAAIDHLTAGWRRIDALRVCISPGNRAAPGLAATRAVLSWTGQPVRVFRDGGWTTAPGWGLTRRVAIPGLGDRLAALAETADLDLLVERYGPRLAAEMLAGLELPILHRGLAAAGLLVRGRLLRSLAPLAPLFHWVAGWCRRAGSDRGGMLVEAVGRDAEDRPAVARWSLVAGDGQGPAVPTLPALALVRRIRDRKLDLRGAAPCVGLIGLAELQGDFTRLGITTATERHPLPAPLFARAMGPRFAALPAATRHIHQPDPVLILSGSADVDGADNTPGRVVASLFGLPPAARTVPLRVTIEATAEGGEHWARVYPRRTMRSLMSDPEPDRAVLTEQFGPFRFALQVEPTADGLTLTPLTGRLGRWVLPLALMPRVTARETADGETHRFDVTITMPLLGRLVHYRGWLRPA